MRILSLLLTMMLTAPGLLLAATSALHLATADGIPLSLPDGTGFHDQVVREACRRIGLDMTPVHLPAERALINANAGIEAGVYVRVQGLDALYPNLRIVPEKITDYEFVAFIRERTVRLTDWGSLQNYHVGIITGWKILETNIKHFKSLTKVKDAVILFKALVDGKVDLIIYNRLDGYGTMKELDLHGIYDLEMPLATKEMFLYLHKDWQHLIPPLTDSLKAMKNDGTYATIKQSVLAPYLPE